MDTANRAVSVDIDRLPIPKHETTAWPNCDPYSACLGVYHWRSASLCTPISLKSDDDTSFWLASTVNMLRALLFYAGYEGESQDQILEFYTYVVLPKLGPPPLVGGFPPAWRSFMTDDFSPVEFSWKWSNDGSGPVVRYSVEAIGGQVGTSVDPWNQMATLEWIQQLRRTMPGVNLQHFDILSCHTLASSNISVSQALLDRHGHCSSIFLAFEFVNQTPKVKAYMLPLIKALQSSQSQSVIICDALVALERKIPCPGLRKMINFLKTTAQDLQLHPFIVACDLDRSAESRIRVYARSSDTSFAGVEVIMTMFDTSENTRNGLKELRNLWQLTLGLDDNFCPNLGLPAKSHPTSGILYYFEVHLGSPRITTKVYLPVRHYSRNDQAIADGLATFFTSRGGNYKSVVKSYLMALNRICAHRSLDSICGLHTYISCAIKEGALEITSYLNPQVYQQRS